MRVLSSTAENRDYVSFPRAAEFLVTDESGDIYAVIDQVFGVGLARVQDPEWKDHLARCFAAALLLHFLWDWIALGALDDASLSPPRTVAAMALMLSGIVFYGALVLAGSTKSKRMFAPAARAKLWGWPFTAFLRDR